ncbi:MAG: sarcosine oxidase subunit gamma [Paracoccaceae bacterium]
MASLIETGPCDGLLPMTIGDAQLAETSTGRLTSVAPFNGTAKGVAAGLKTLGLGWPEPGQSVSAKSARILWTGRGQALLFNADPAPLHGLAALTDQSDGWAGLALSGPDAEAVLARLVPVDLRDAAFPVGGVIRTGLNHMMMILVREEMDRFMILVFRSMVRSAIHELSVAMEAVAARAAVTPRVNA